VCDRHGTVLIFDEVMTGFRVALGGAQSHYGVKPDMTTLGKVIGGGMPVGAFGGRADIMNVVAPLGGVYQAGTLSGNPIAMTAGLATLELIQAPGFFEQLSERTQQLTTGLSMRAEQANIHFSTHSVGGMFGFFFTSSNPVTGFAQVMNANADQFNTFFNSMLDQGINLAPSPFESGFVSAAHSTQDIEETLRCAEIAFAAL
jgi:glutamate-1-semialdehyde 2,1-aminomutase